MHDASTNLCASYRRPGFKPSRSDLAKVARQWRVMRWSRLLPESRCRVSRLCPRPPLVPSWSCARVQSACFVSSPSGCA